MNFGLYELNFEDIRENQSKVVESLPQWSRYFDDFADRIRKKSYLSYRAVCDRFLQTWRIAKEMIFSVPRNFSSGFVNE